MSNKSSNTWPHKRQNRDNPSPKWSSDWSVGVRVWVERQGQTVLEESVADVLMELDRTKSISAAARSLGISYRHAWLLVQQANENAGQPLVATAIGGRQGGGTRLTEHGRAALSVFQQVQNHVRNAAAKALPKIVESTTHDASVVHLAAAISLQEVIALALNEYALVRPTVSVRTIFGASNELTDQIAAGSPADVFISASGTHITRLAKSGLIDRKSRCTLASNGLAIVGDPAHVKKLRKPSDLRGLSDCPILVADPACPLGRCSEELLKGEGLFDELRPRMKYVDNSRAVVASVRAGQPRVGIIFGSDIANAPGITTLLRIPSSRVKAVYEGAVVANSAVIHEARALLQFFSSRPAQGCFRACGFSI